MSGDPHRLLLFGMRVHVAPSMEEWRAALSLARDLGAVDIGNATRTDHDIVINEAAGVIMVNPAREAEVLAAFRRAIPEVSKDAGAEPEEG